MMKFTLFACLVIAAIAEPEAKPEAQFYRGYGGYAAGYPTTYGYGIRNYGYSAYNRGFYGKREADPEPEAEAEPYNTYGVGHVGAYSGGYAAGYPSTYGYGLRNFGYSAYNRGFYGKREADAKPEAEAEPYLNYGVGHVGAYSGGYAAGYPSTYGYGLRNFGYSAYNRGFYGKREADAEPEAEAEPYLNYRVGHVGAYSAGYAGGYPSTYGYGLRNFGYSAYNHGFYGKREADAEPEAEAEPYLNYGVGHVGAYSGGYAAAYPSTYGYGLRNFGYSAYNNGFYGKREADAEPKAEAEPFLTYGAYSAGYAPSVATYSTYGYPAYNSYGHGGYGRYYG